MAWWAVCLLLALPSTAIATIDRFLSFAIENNRHLNIFSGLAAAAQTSRVLITLFSFDRSIFFSLALFSKVGVMSVQLLRFSFPFQFHVLVDTDTYKASILIWRISLSFQTCSERQIGMFYPHLKYFPTLMEIHFVDDLANPESIRSSFMTLGSKKTMASIFCVINGFTITKKITSGTFFFPSPMLSATNPLTHGFPSVSLSSLCSPMTQTTSGTGGGLN